MQIPFFLKKSFVLSDKVRLLVQQKGIVASVYYVKKTLIENNIKIKRLDQYEQNLVFKVSRDFDNIFSFYVF